MPNSFHSTSKSNRYGRSEQEDDVESPEAGVLARERTSAIDAVLATLHVDARTALLLSADGFSGEEIAATIGRSHAATRTLIFRARVRVRLELERTGDVRCSSPTTSSSSWRRRRSTSR